MTQNIIKKQYTFSSIPDKIKKELAIVKFDVNEYKKKIDEYKQDRPSNQFYYDYDLELDFSENPKISFNIDDRWYYYKAYHYQKLGLFLRKDAPPFKVSLSHLSPEIIYELSELDDKDRTFVLKQSVGGIFEDINFNLYHDSISANLEVVLVK
ncbi:MAG: hypothetical protein ACR2F1_05560 [Nitrososphaeraceae archaeon]